MVGKGVDLINSRIFQQCYTKCCKLQNLTPLNNVLPSGSGKVLEFCVDRIKYADWPPILNALSRDLSLHSIAIKCRQSTKTVLEHIDCERLAKTVNKRAVILTNFMLGNLVEALAQCLADTTLLATMRLEGLPLKIPYLNPLCEAILLNNSLRHVHLSRCAVGDAGCLSLCRAVRCLPGILTLDLSGCELTATGAAHIADLVKYQKIHRYSENWVHTLRYRLPDLDTMAGLRRITLCSNPALQDAGVALLFEVLADDLWIKALDIQDCGLSEASVSVALQLLRSNTTLAVLDVRHNFAIPAEAHAQLRGALGASDRSTNGDGSYSWLSSLSGSSSEGRTRCTASKNNVKLRDRSSRTQAYKYAKTSSASKKDKDYSESLEEQLQEEISHRHQVEELNLRLVDQVRQLKRQQIQLWANEPASSGSERSFPSSELSSGTSSASGLASTVRIEQNTLAYIQHAFRDIYAFIKENQCQGQCAHDRQQEPPKEIMVAQGDKSDSEHEEEARGSARLRVNMVPKKAHSTHVKLTHARVHKSTKSAHMLGERGAFRDTAQVETTPEMFEKQIGDTKNAHVHNKSLLQEMVAIQTQHKKMPPRERCSPCSSTVSDSSDTLVCMPDPRHALISTDEESDEESERSEPL